MQACLPLFSSFFQPSLQGTIIKLFLFFRCHINSKDVSPHMSEETEPYHLFSPKSSLSAPKGMRQTVHCKESLIDNWQTLYAYDYIVTAFLQ